MLASVRMRLSLRAPAVERPRALIGLITAICALGAGVDAALADGRLPAGSAIEIKNVVTGRIEKDKRQLETGLPVHVNELIEATKDSRGEFQLRDETKLVVAAGARLMLDKFVYDPDAKPGAVVLNLTRGAMRFVTGKSSKENYEIKTPVATIGVRGTIFDAFVSTEGELAVLLLEGAVEVCTGQGSQRRCILHDRLGEFVHVRRGSPIRQTPKYDGSFMRRQPIQAAFPFVGEPPSFNRDPTWNYEGLRAPFVPVVPFPPRGGGGGGRGDGGGKGSGDGGGKGKGDSGGKEPRGDSGGGRKTDAGGRSDGGSGGVRPPRGGGRVVIDVRIPKRPKKDDDYERPRRRGDHDGNTGGKRGRGDGSASGGRDGKPRGTSDGPPVTRRAGTSIGRSAAPTILKMDRNPVRPFIMQPRLR